jgi:hypothetical protein
MANTVIQLKKSATPSAVPSSLENGELAINYADGILFYKAANGTILPFSSGGGGGGSGNNTFATVNVNGTLLVSDSPTSILTIIPGSGIEVTGYAANDTLSIAAPSVSSAFDKANSALEKSNTGGIIYTIDAGDNSISTGLAGVGLQVPFAANIQSVTLLANTAGNCVIDIWKGTYSNFPLSSSNTIVSANYPSLSSALKNTTTTLTSWSRDIAIDDILQFNVVSADTINKLVIIIKVLKT